MRVGRFTQEPPTGVARRPWDSLPVPRGCARRGRGGTRRVRGVRTCVAPLSGPRTPLGLVASAKAAWCPHVPGGDPSPGFVWVIPRVSTSRDASGPRGPSCSLSPRPVFSLHHFLRFSSSPCRPRNAVLFKCPPVSAAFFLLVDIQVVPEVLLWELHCLEPSGTFTGRRRLSGAFAKEMNCCNPRCEPVKLTR